MDIKFSKFIKHILYKNKLKFYMCNFFINSFFFKNTLAFSKLKIFFLKVFRQKIPHGIIKSSKINDKIPSKLCVTNKTWLSNEVRINNIGQVKIENGSSILGEESMVTDNHDFKNETFDYFRGSIKNESHSWIALSSIIFPSTSINKNGFIKVRSIINK